MNIYSLLVLLFALVFFYCFFQGIKSFFKAMKFLVVVAVCVTAIVLILNGDAEQPIQELVPETWKNSISNLISHL